MRISRFLWCAAIVLTSSTSTASPLDSVKDHAPNAQAKVLADGKVTYAGMESLGAQAVKFLKARGISTAQHIPTDIHHLREDVVNVRRLQLSLQKANQ